MSKELIVNSTEQEVVIALVEDKQLVELHREKNNTMHSVGDVFLGRVKKIMPGLNAAFVEVGAEKEGFLHYLDVGTQFSMFNRFTQCAINGDRAQTDIQKYKSGKEDAPKNAKISSVLKQNQSILVQVTKEPISTKGPRLSAEISFPGRYLVLVPFSNKVSISQKIKDPEERSRLKSLIQSIRPHNFGVIIRTVAAGRSVADLDADLTALTKKWAHIERQLLHAKAPMKVCSEMDKAVSILRDFLNNDFNQIATNDPQMFDEIQAYIMRIAPEKKDIVRLYKGKEPIFDHYGISKQIKSLFGKVVNLRHNGAYIVVEHTEAMHVIDVNSGHRMNADQSQESNSLQVNLDAAQEVARQVRLRDMGGIIIVDFIDQREAANRKILFDAMVKAMENDPSKHTVLPPTKFGLIQITRQRFRPQTQVKVLETCPTCGGTGEIKPSICLTDEIDKQVDFLIKDTNARHFTVVVHPYVYAYLRSHWRHAQRNWWRLYRRWIKLRSYDSLNFLEYKFYDKSGEEIQL